MQSYLGEPLFEKKIQLSLRFVIREKAIEIGKKEREREKKKERKSIFRDNKRQAVLSLILSILTGHQCPWYGKLPRTTELHVPIIRY